MMKVVLALCVAAASAFSPVAPAYGLAAQPARSDVVVMAAKKKGVNPALFSTVAGGPEGREREGLAVAGPRRQARLEAGPRQRRRHLLPRRRPLALSARLTHVVCLAAFASGDALP